MTGPLAIARSFGIMWYILPHPVGCVLLVSLRTLGYGNCILFAPVTTRPASVLQPPTTTAAIIQAQIERPRHRCLGATTPNRS